MAYTNFAMEPERLFNPADAKRLGFFYLAMMMLYVVCPPKEARFYIKLLMGLESDELRNKAGESFFYHCFEELGTPLPDLGDEWANEVLAMMTEGADEAINNHIIGCSKLAKELAVQRLLY